MNTTVPARPGVVGRFRSRQSGLPTGLLGRIIGRAMVGATADSNDRALAMLDLGQPCTVLEVGFGQGRTAAKLIGDGHRVIGVDASPTMVKQATARNRAACRDGRATLRHGDGVTIPFPDTSADAAITAHTIYFMPDPSVDARRHRPRPQAQRLTRGRMPHQRHDNARHGWIPTSTASRAPPRSSPCCTPPASTMSSTSQATRRTMTSTCSSPDFPAELQHSVSAPGNPTTDALLAALRRHADQPAMAWARPPAALTGGYWAEMYVDRVVRSHARARRSSRRPDHARSRDRRLRDRRAAPPHTMWIPRAGHSLCRRAEPRDRSCLERDGLRHWATTARRAQRRIRDQASSNPAAATTRPPRRGRCGAPPLSDRWAHGELGDHGRQPDIDDFIKRIGVQADNIGRRDLARTAEHLAATTHETRVICHGDLHPFNLLVDGDRWTLIDWSTAVLADPHYDLAFTTLMLANPPLGGPAPLRAATRAIGTRLANRFLRSYEQQSGRSVDRERLSWGRRAHALRALVEIATWEANDTIDAHREHPWLTMRPVLERELGRADIQVSA